jgi:hypothetical protein
MVSGPSFISKKRSPKKISPKNNTPGSLKKFIPDSGGKEVPDPQHSVQGLIVPVLITVIIPVQATKESYNSLLCIMYRLKVLTFLKFSPNI